ncbi:metallo-mystery pair system four-Cys motif protein [Psychromonas sp. psych-6C06]|nr:metallo-mystery pair system four-Cys motif protein [Psychromonas sp. psych-6C06]
MLVSLVAGCGSSVTSSEIDRIIEPELTEALAESLETLDQEIKINFAARVGSEDIACEKMESIVAGSSNVNPEFTDVRLYVSSFSLINSAGDSVPVTLNNDQKWQYKEVALLDFENGTGSCSNGNPDLNNVVSGTVPAGDYTGVEFTIGVPVGLNHLGIDGDDAVSPLDVTGMNWSWQKGHKHLRMDVKGWNLHLGTTGCELVDAATETVDCANSRGNRPTYQLDNFDAANNTIVLDYLKLVENSDLAVNADNTPLGCMSGSNDSDCEAIFNNLGLTLSSGECTDGNCSALQSWVSVE